MRRPRPKAGSSARLILAVAVLGLFSFPAASRAGEGPIDLLSQYDVRLDGTGGGWMGISVAGGASINGDGTPDFVVGAQASDAGSDSLSDEGHVYVVFGDGSPGVVAADDVDERGFVIEGGPGEEAGKLVAIAGDVNNDGRDDIIVANDDGGTDSVYVVFGKSDTSTVPLPALAKDGFEITGDDLYVTSVASAGDVNSDGKADVIVGNAYADYNGRNGSGSAFVIFGKTSTTTVDLDTLGAGGFRIDGGNADDNAGQSVAGAGDLNEDGMDDVVVGIPLDDGKTRNNNGTANVVFGKTTTTNVDLASETGGFSIIGPETDFRAGFSVAGLGDVNNDGREDLAVGAPDADYNGRAASGSVFVVFGRSSIGTIDLAALDTGGFRIDGPETFPARLPYGLGFKTAAAGDVNDDGKDDLILGLATAGYNERTESGSAFVVFGTASTSSLDLESLDPASGFRIDGAEAYDAAGFSVSGAGDADNDGDDDVLVGAPAYHSESTGPGAAYVEFVAEWLPGDCANPRSGTSGDDTLIGGEDGDDITGGGGADDLRGEGGNDCVKGEEGADVVRGGEGADTVKGGSGHDTTITGGDGGDTVNGGDGNDGDMSGGEGEDTMAGEAGTDTLDGGGDRDDITGGRGGDTLLGGQGGDELDGGKGADELDGSDGEDTLTGGAGEDTITAGPNDDIIYAEDGEVDTIECGQGSDTVFADPEDDLISC